MFFFYIDYIDLVGSVVHLELFRSSSISVVVLIY